MHRPSTYPPIPLYMYAGAWCKYLPPTHLSLCTRTPLYMYTGAAFRGLPPTHPSLCTSILGLISDTFHLPTHPFVHVYWGCMQIPSTYPPIPVYMYTGAGCRYLPLTHPSLCSCILGLGAEAFHPPTHPFVHVYWDWVQRPSTYPPISLYMYTETGCIYLQPTPLPPPPAIALYMYPGAACWDLPHAHPSLCTCILGLGADTFHLPTHPFVHVYWDWVLGPSTCPPIPVVHVSWGCMPTF